MHEQKEITRRRRLVYVDDGVPAIGTRFIRTSCHERGVDFVPIDPNKFEFAPANQLVAGDLLYRPAVSWQAQRVEQFLHAPGVATFYRGESLLFHCTNSTLLFQRSGIPIPRTVQVFSNERSVLDRYAERLGGFPIVYKVPGYSTGIGVGRLDSAAALYSFVDLMIAMSRHPFLMAYIPDAVNWRLVVVGDRVIASYRSVIARNDFRSEVTANVADYSAEPPEEAVMIAVESTHLLGNDLGGVDVLVHQSGRVYLLENNFPCFFAQSQRVAGNDISGAMLDFLIAKAERLNSESSSQGKDGIH